MIRFTIREVVLLTGIVGLATGWCVDRQQLTKRQEFLLEGASRLQEHFNHKYGREVPLIVDGRSWPTGEQVDYPDDQQSLE